MVVFSFENRRWVDVGGVGFGSMPYLHALAESCVHFALSWGEGEHRTEQPDPVHRADDRCGAAGDGNDCSPRHVLDAPRTTSSGRRVGREDRDQLRGRCRQPGAPRPGTRPSTSRRCISGMLPTVPRAMRTLARTVSSIRTICPTSRLSLRRTATTGTTARTDRGRHWASTNVQDRCSTRLRIRPVRSPCSSGTTRICRFPTCRSRRRPRPVRCPPAGHRLCVDIPSVGIDARTPVPRQRRCTAPDLRGPANV